MRFYDREIDIDLAPANKETVKRAAAAYIAQNISGLELALVLTNATGPNAKCKACAAWVQKVNQQARLRLTKASKNYDASLNNFQDCGPMPFTADELLTEVAGKSNGD